MNSNRTAWLLISPTIFILVLVGLVPFLYVLYVGFFNWMPLGKIKDMQFISLGDNYRDLMFDEYFLGSIWRSIKFAFVTLFFELSIGFILALSLLSSFPLKSFFRSVHTLPLVIAPIVVGAIFKLFNYEFTLNYMFDHQVPYTEISLIIAIILQGICSCLLYTSPSPRDQRGSRIPSWG